MSVDNGLTATPVLSTVDKPIVKPTPRPVRPSSGTTKASLMKITDPAGIIVALPIPPPLSSTLSKNQTAFLILLVKL